MKYVEGQFVCLPQLLNLNELNVKYTDILVYVALRSFDGSEGCFPSYESIAERAKCSRSFVVQAVKRLEAAKLITVQRSKKKFNIEKTPVNKYEFTEYYMFERIPYSFFDLELNLHDKAMLLNLRQFFQMGAITPFYKIKDLANKLGLSYKVIHQRVKSLISKGYMAHVERKPNRDITYYRYEFTDKFKWIYGYQRGSVTKEVKNTVLRVS